MNFISIPCLSYELGCNEARKCDRAQANRSIKVPAKSADEGRKDVFLLSSFSPYVEFALLLLVRSQQPVPEEKSKTIPAPSKGPVKSGNPNGPSQ
jgi:hypothetical protein